MKSLDNFDENIKKYYDGSLDGATSNELELKEALDKMSIASNIDDKVPISIDVSSIVEKGQELRLSVKLRKATFRFLVFAILLSTSIGVLYIKTSIEVIMISQTALLIVLLIINFILLRKKSRREVH
jgi:hypothetical protein